MKLIVQRSLESSVFINSSVEEKINNGLVVLVGFTHNDNEEIIDKMVEKLINLRIFSDSEGKMNLSLLDVKGSILSISQFTLYADITHGRRPSFTSAMEQEQANNLYSYFNKKIEYYNINIKTGVFGADMLVNIKNDGPVTIIMDSNDFI